MAAANAATTARLERALMVAAQLVEENPHALPLFDRIEAELNYAQVARSASPIERVRALRQLRQEWQAAG